MKELYDLCDKHQLRLSGIDLIRIACKPCEQDETRPPVLMGEYESMHTEDESEQTSSGPSEG